MRKTVVFFLLSSLAILLFTAPQSRGDGVETFTLTEVVGIDTYSATWQSLVAPDTTGNSSAGFDFLLPAVSVDLSIDGALWFSGPLDLTFFNQNSGTGELFDAGGLFGLDGIGQLYVGSEDSPTFSSGTYTGTDHYLGYAATLDVSAPEPNSLFLLFSGLLAFAGVLLVRKLQL